jgi:hypothetical protein
LRTQSGASGKSGDDSAEPVDADGELGADDEAAGLLTALDVAEGGWTVAVVPVEVLPEGLEAGAPVHDAARARSSAAVPSRQCNGIAR